MKPRITTLHRLGLLALLVAASMPASAQERSLTTEQLTAGSDMVVVGRVAGTKSSWTPDRRRIVTTVSIAVEEELKGQGTGATVSVVIPGGEVDGVGEWYSHSARFSKDEEVVVFAKKDKEGKLRVSGGSQGKFSVSRDAEKGARVGGGRSLEEFTAGVRKAVQQAAPEN